QAELREGRNLADRRHPEGGRIVRRRGGRIVGEDRRLVGAVAVGVEEDRALVGDRLAGGAGVDEGRDGDRHRAAGGDGAVPVHRPVGHVGRGRAGGGAGGDQRQAGRQDVGELVARVV